MASARHLFGRMRRFAREYTDGVRAEDLRRLFDRDAAEAYRVLTRGRPVEPEPRGRLRRLVHRGRIFFLGLSYTLSPVRRLVFAAAMVAAVLGFAEVRFTNVSNNVTVEGSRLFFAVSVAALVFLLTLELVDRVRVRDELELARDLQRQLLPEAAPPLAGYAFASSYRTANEVGGDYYDFVPLADGRLALVAGDASGHGMAAGLVMAIANATLKLALDLDPDPLAVSRLVNRAVWRTGGTRAFMTLFCGLLDPDSGRLDFVNAGHPYPLLRGPDGSVTELGNGCVPLGLREDPPLAAHRAQLDPGSVLLLYSDGLPEAVDREGRAFGFERVAELLAPGGSARQVHERMLVALKGFIGAEPLADDVSLVAVERCAIVPPLPQDA